MGQCHPSYCVMLRYKLLLLLENENRRLCGEVFANIPSQRNRLRHLGWCGREHRQIVIRCLVKDQLQTQIKGDVQKVQETVLQVDQGGSWRSFLKVDDQRSKWLVIRLLVDGLTYKNERSRNVKMDGPKNQRGRSGSQTEISVRRNAQFGPFVLSTL